MKTFRTLCSGGELFGVGARAAGWTHVDGYEIDPAIAAVARLNGFDVRAADVTRIDYASLPPADHLHASPSCKTASQANTAGGETAGDLAVADAICRAIRAHTGRTFSLENVWGYRKYESFDRILTTLRACGFGVHVAHVNAADFGVPQTRKRLILRAVRGIERVPGLRPTHGKRGGILLARWNGWYAAIADILHTLPPTEPAPWQLARLPTELRETMLYAQNNSQDRHGNSYGATGRAADEPALCMTTATAGWWKAFLLNGAMSAGNAVVLREADEPSVTVVAADDRKLPMRAYLVQSKNTSQQWGDGTRDEDEPAFSIVTDHKPSHAPKAYASGRWVRMTVQASGRFQTVPDSYVGLTPEINGNGVPCDLAQAIMESL